MLYTSTRPAARAHAKSAPTTSSSYSLSLSLSLLGLEWKGSSALPLLLSLCTASPTTRAVTADDERQEHEKERATGPQKKQRLPADEPSHPSLFLSATPATAPLPLLASISVVASRLLLSPLDGCCSTTCATRPTCALESFVRSSSRRCIVVIFLQYDTLSYSIHTCTVLV